MTTATRPKAAEQPAEPSFLAALAVREIKPHPANPRREAKADAEMVASIKERGVIQPLIVAPATKGKGYVILAGHRRLDGLKRAKRTTTPAIVRHDITTDAEQIEFAVIENVHRQDLTPMEEAEAFDQLRQMKYTQAEISKKTGRTVSTVRERLKLIKLSSQSRDALHKGQLTIGDAFDLLEFTDDPKTEASLTKKAGQPGFRQYLEQARRDRQRAIDIAEAKAKHDADGIPEANWPAGVTNTYDLKPTKGVVMVGDTAERDPKKHQKAGCLGYLVAKQSYQQPTYLVCTAPKTHKKTLTAAEKRQRAEAEKAKQARLEREEQEDISRTLREASIFELLGEGIQFSPRFRDVLRALLPSLVWDLEGTQIGRYCTAMAIDTPWPNYSWDRTGEKVLPFTTHAQALAEASDATLAKALSAVLLSHVECLVSTLTHGAPGDTARPQMTAAYLELLAGIGHEFTDIDDELRTKATSLLPSSTESADQPPAADATDVADEDVPTPDDPSFEPHAFAGKEGYACADCEQPADAAIHAEGTGS